jgi:ABC-type nitrate/sulfonate/bicarbonate transport system ATPase subunit
MTAPAIRIRGLSKSFTLHHQGGVRLPVLHGVDLDVAAGEAVVLHGPSGAGKSSLLRCLYGNYLADAGSIEVRGSTSRAPTRARFWRCAATPWATSASSCARSRACPPSGWWRSRPSTPASRPRSRSIGRAACWAA